LLPRGDILSYEHIYAIAQAAAELGIRKLRITGGEPLARKDLPSLLEMLSGIKELEELTLTTNGTLLKHYAGKLKEAGLKRVNVSLDTLKRDRFRSITRFGELEDVLSGIEAAKEAGLHPVKINTVVMRGINDDEVEDFASLTYRKAWHVRFIELMPFTEGVEFVSESEVRRRIENIGCLEPYPYMTGNGPAKYCRLVGAEGTIGFVSPLTDAYFCSTCNRIRLTPEGKLRPCLLMDNEVDLRGVLHSKEEVKKLILRAVSEKPMHHPTSPLRRKMAQIGG
jgi:cyclic pyranopterin phosphate synthase